MLGKGVCVHSALPWGLITSAATKQPASYLLYKRLVSLQGEIFKEYSMIALLRYEQFLNGIVHRQSSLSEKWPGCLLDASWPSLRWGGKAWGQTNGGISSFQFSESLNAEVQTFLVPETCSKACNLTARSAAWWIYVRFEGVSVTWGCCLMRDYQTQAVGENTNVWTLTLLLFSHRWSGEAPLLPALISSFALHLLLFLYEEALRPQKC